MKRHLKAAHSLIKAHEHHLPLFFTAFFAGVFLILLLRMLLTLQGITASDSGFGAYWVDISSPLVALFTGILADITTEEGYIESASLIASVFYAFLAWLGYLCSRVVVKDPRQFIEKLKRLRPGKKEPAKLVQKKKQTVTLKRRIA